jgi:hypothetical protein
LKAEAMKVENYAQVYPHLLIRDVFLHTDCLFGRSCQRTINSAASIAVGRLWFVDIERLEKPALVSHDQRPHARKRTMSPALKTKCDDGLKEIFSFATWFKKK